MVKSVTYLSVNTIKLIKHIRFVIIVLDLLCVRTIKVKNGPKKCFDQLSGARSNKKLVEIHNTHSLKRVLTSLFFYSPGGVFRQGLPSRGVVHQDRGRRPHRHGKTRDQIRGRFQFHLKTIRTKIFAAVRSETREHHIVTLS